MEKGLIHVYTGDGKGKTTAGMGLCVRAAGNKMKVLVYQFLKSENTCERKILHGCPYIELIDLPKSEHFTFGMNAKQTEKYRENYAQKLTEIEDMCRKRKVDVLLLDEINCAVAYGLLDEELVLDFLKNKPKKLEVIMTGRDATTGIIEAADYVTEMKKLRHPFDKGTQARKGIEL
ncbi:MAG: cob(I)yrinic acid a,c-diamide adenosyltransferase [Eggerthellaceae bacterium]|nr:cob(I)yrinic acid a,c-diamide adenosyltransferase [Eggerthellaceae bacterium]